MNSVYRVAYPYLYGRKLNVNNITKNNQIFRSNIEDKNTILTGKVPTEAEEKSAMTENAFVAEQYKNFDTSILKNETELEPIVDESTVETGLSLLQKKRGSGFKYKASL